jgi:hypothetical protein
MGKSNFDDEEDRHSLRKRRPRHSKNLPGKGMRVINIYEDEEDDDPFSDELDTEDEIFITHTKSR